MNEVPVLNLENLNKASNLKGVMQLITSDFKDLGFAYIKNHGVSDELFSEMFAAARKFHDLPMASKLRIRQNSAFRGYVPTKQSQVKVSSQGSAKKPNTLEAFVMMHEVAEEHPDYIAGNYLAGPNQWPDEMPSLRDVMTRYRDEMSELGKKMVEIFAQAFGLNHDALNQYFINPTFFLRLQHYPRSKTEANEQQFGIAPHTDIGFLTFVAQDNVGGLEVKHPQRGWIQVPNIPGTLVMNAGDMLKHWTNGTYASVPHRVINSTNSDRYSIPFFFDPNMHATIEPIQNDICGFSNVLEPVMYGDYVMKRVTKNYPDLSR